MGQAGPRASPLSQRSRGEDGEGREGVFSYITPGKTMFCFALPTPIITIKDGLNSLQGVSVCDHLQTVLSSLGDLGKITLSTSGPPEPDQSLLNHPEFWDMATVQHAPGKPFSNATGGILQVVWLGDSQSFALFFSNVCLERKFYFTDPVLDSRFLQYLDSMAAEAQHQGGLLKHAWRGTI